MGSCTPALSNAARRSSGAAFPLPSSTRATSSRCSLAISTMCPECSLSGSMPVFHRGTVRRSQFVVGRVSITLEIQAYDQLCVPGHAAQWADQAGRRPFVGALTLELPTDADDEVLSWVAAGTPPIYFGFGSTPLTSPADTIAVISAACTSLADHVKMVEAVNHAAVFPACRAVVHHGGVGTTAAGLRAGVPSLALWVGLDQRLWAGAIECLKSLPHTTLRLSTMNHWLRTCASY